MITLRNKFHAFITSPAFLGTFGVLGMIDGATMEATTLPTAAIRVAIMLVGTTSLALAFRLCTPAAEPAKIDTAVSLGVNGHALGRALAIGGDTGWAIPHTISEYDQHAAALSRLANENIGATLDEFQDRVRARYPDATVSGTGQKITITLRSGATFVVTFGSNGEGSK